MSEQKSSEAPFKMIATKLLEVNADPMQLPRAFQQPFQCFVRETFPYFMVTDGHHYINLSFTQEALDQFHKESGMSICDTQHFLVCVDKWSVELGLVANSRTDFMSCSSLTFKFIVHHMSLGSKEKLRMADHLWPANLYRDPEMIAHINHFLFSEQQKTLKEVGFDGLRDRVSLDGHLSQHNYRSYQFLKRSSTEVAALPKPKHAMKVREIKAQILRQM